MLHQTSTYNACKTEEAGRWVLPSSTTMSSVGDGDQLMITNAGVAGCTVGDCSMSLDEGEATDSGLSSIGNNVFLCEGGCVT